MLSQFVKGRVYVFIDVENIFYSQRSLGWHISYEKLIKYFRDECGPDAKCFAYTGVNESNKGQHRFLDMLDLSGYVVRMKTVKKIKSGGGSYKWKNNLDMELAFEMINTSEKYDTAILLSGDSDFSLPIDYIKQRGKRIIVMSTRKHISKELLERAKYIELRKLKDIISQ